MLHRYGFMGLPIIVIVDNSDRSIAWNRKYISRFKHMASIRLNDLCFAGNKPYQDVMFKNRFRLKKRALISGQLSCHFFTQPP